MNHLCTELSILFSSETCFPEKIWDVMVVKAAYLFFHRRQVRHPVIRVLTLTAHVEMVPIQKIAHVSVQNVTPERQGRVMKLLGSFFDSVL